MCVKLSVIVSIFEGTALGSVIAWSTDDGKFLSPDRIGFGRWVLIRVADHTILEPDWATFGRFSLNFLTLSCCFPHRNQGLRRKIFVYF